MRNFRSRVSAVTKQAPTGSRRRFRGGLKIGSYTKARVWVAMSLAIMICATPVYTFTAYDADLTGLVDR